MPTSPGPAPDLIAPALLEWYDRHHRDLPWRTPPGRIAEGVRPDPYRVWLSEIMLQQTTVAAVKPYYTRFVRLWPDVAALARAETDAVMSAWAGLGYYSRARNLKACAETVLARYAGRFPDDERALLALPGIGAYTAAAIAAIAFDRPAPVVDGNVERVVARLHAIDTPLPGAKRRIRALVEAMVPAGRPGDFAQAMMDLGAMICTPRRPACALCPLRGSCLAIRMGGPERFPVKAIRPDKPLRSGAAFVAFRSDGAVLLRKRPLKGLLAGMAEPPGSAWTARQDGGTDVSDAPFPADWRLSGRVRHVFTHFELDLSVYRVDLAPDFAAPPDYWWSTAIHGEPLPTVMKKAIEAAAGDVRQAQRGKRRA